MDLKGCRKLTQWRRLLSHFGRVNAPIHARFTGCMCWRRVPSRTAGASRDFLRVAPVVAKWSHWGHMIALQGLTKRFGSRLAVEALTFEIPAGQIVGFLGPNGAGKSTTLKMLTGILEPSDGTA